MNIILGTITFGQQVEAPEAIKMVTLFRQSGYSEVDTAHVYNGGRSEEIIGEVLKRGDISGMKIATKVNPRVTGKLDAQAVYDQVAKSFERMGIDQADTLYLHFPDPDVPVEEPLKACQRLYERGAFRNLGLSNYPAWMVADVCHKCDSMGFVKPTVYEGVYNALSRRVEDELFAALRYFGISFNAYNPLAGGMLTGKHQCFGDGPQEGRFAVRESYKKRYWRESFFCAVDALRDVCIQAEISIPEASFRWLANHSMLDKVQGDGIIVGASNAKQLEQDLMFLKAGALPRDVEDCFKRAWLVCQADAPPYFRFADE